MGKYHHTYITGTENEFSVSGEASRLIDRAVLSRGHVFGHVTRGAHLWGLNGCRAYPDVREKQEYATPECRTGREAAVYELAGALYWAIMARLADLQLGKPDAETHILKTNTLANGSNGGGNHINVCMPARGVPYASNIARLVEFLQGFIATFELVTGSGILLPPFRPVATLIKGTDFRYGIGARGYQTVGDLGTSNCASEFGGRQLFLKRDEPLGQMDQMWRLQICGLDSIVEPAMLIFKLELVMLLCEMAARRALTPIYLIENQDGRHPAHLISLDWRRTLETADHGRLTALQVQWHYHTEAQKFVADRRHGRGQELLDRWAMLLSGFDTSENVPTKLCGHVPWVTQFFALERAAKSDKPGWRQFDYLRAEDLYFLMRSYRLQANGRRCYPIQQIWNYDRGRLLAAVGRALFVPPSDTRAFARSQIARLPESRIHSMFWDHAIVDGERVPLPYPADPMPAELVAALRAPAPIKAPEIISPSESTDAA